MTNTQSWTVYTVIDEGLEGYVILATRWTDDGPQPDPKRVARLLAVTRDEAQARATEMQASYDRVRNAMAADR